MTVRRLPEPVYRADVQGGMWFRFDGTRWVSETVFTQAMDRVDGIAIATTVRGFNPWGGLYDLYVNDFGCVFFVAGTNDASNYWSCAWQILDSGSGLASVTTAAGVSANTSTAKRTSIASLLSTLSGLSAGNPPSFNVAFTKVGLPASVIAFPFYTYRIVAP